MMRKLFVSLAGIVAFAAPAAAADMPAKMLKAPPPVVASSWSGCYVGGNVGYAWADKEFIFAATGLNEGSHKADGVVGGGQVGCDLQVGGNWVFGIRGMWDASDQRGQHEIPPAGSAFFYKTDIKSFATVTGSVGFLVQPNVLLYGLVGFGWVNEDYRFFNAAGTRFATASETRGGVDAGFGVAWKFAPNWNMFVEYDHIFLPERTVRFGNGTDNFDERIRQGYDKVLVGVNYRFGGSGPVVARY